jgi:hypothetical protein
MSKIKHNGNVYCLITLRIQIQEPCNIWIFVFVFESFGIQNSYHKERENIPKKNVYLLPPSQNTLSLSFFCLLCLPGSVSGIENWIGRAPGRSVGIVIVQETRETNTHRMVWQVRKCIRRQQGNSEVKTQARLSQRGIRTTDVLIFHVSLFFLFLFNFFSFVHSFLLEPNWIGIPNPKPTAQITQYAEQYTQMEW